MKRIILYLALICASFTSCTLTEFYVEGYVKTTDITNITENSATCGGDVKITDKGSAAKVTIERGVVYGTDRSDLSHKAGGGSGEGVFTCNLTFLEPNTTYYVRVYASVTNIYDKEKIDEGKYNEADIKKNKETKQETYYGDIKEFTTLEATPETPEPPLTPTIMNTYSMAELSANPYLQDFNDAATSDWTAGGTGVTVGFGGGKLNLQGHGSYYIKQGFKNVDTWNDFQLEVSMQINFKSPDVAGEYIGIMFGDDDVSRYDYFTIASGSNHALSIGASNGSSAIDMYTKNCPGIVLRDFHLFTVRKVGTRMSFFLDTTFVFETVYDNFPPNYGFVLQNGNNVAVDYVRVDYIGNTTQAPPTAASVKTLSTENITHNQVDVIGELTTLGDAQVTDYGFCYSSSTTALPTVSDTKVSLGSTSKLGEFTATLTGLEEQTSYYIRAYAVNSAGASYANEIRIETPRGPQKPTVHSRRTEDVKHNQVTVFGELADFGDDVKVNSYGFCYSTSNLLPTVADSKKTMAGTTQLSEFSAVLTGLQASTKYFIRAFAINDVGTAYSSSVLEVTTATPPTQAVVNSLRSENVKYNKLDVVGELVSLGDVAVSDHGFCYSETNAEPTTAGSKVSLGNTAQVGEFTTTLKSLKAETKYYIRAYVVNSQGTSYGDVIEETTSSMPAIILTGNLVAYYTFDNENCNESQGKTQYNGVLQGTGTPVYSPDIPSNTGKSLQLNNNAYYLMPTSPFASISDNYTITLWVSTLATTQTLFSYQDIYNKPLIAISNSHIYTETYGRSYSNNFSIDIARLLLDGNWHMLTITRASNNCKLYIDAEFLGAVGSSRTSNDPWFLGSGFIGNMDNFRLYNIAITEDEIKELYDAKQ